MDNRELAAVLAGLRLYQRLAPNFPYLVVGTEDQWIGDIATASGTLTMLSDAEIDALCERLNTQPATLGNVLDQLEHGTAPFTVALGEPTPVHVGDATEVLIWSFEHNGWWAPVRQGYVSDVDAAGRYFLAEARQIVEIANIAAINEAIVLLPRNRVPAQRPTGSEEDRR